MANAPLLYPPQQEICSVRYQENLMMHAQGFYALQSKVTHDLSNSNTEALVLSELFTGKPLEQNLFLDLKLNYSHPQGQQSLLAEIAGLYDGIRPDHILVEEGSEEALLLLLQCFLRPSDHLVLQFPCYPPALEIAVNRNERQVSLWEGKIRNNRWVWDLSELEALCGPDTKAVFLCQPHNPTGAVMDEAAYSALIEFARERDLLLICDEVYRFLEYDPGIRRKPMAESYEKGVSIGSLSKAFALPGLRIGWIVVNDERLRDKLISYKSRTTLCNSVVTQYLAEMALRRKREILASTNGRVKNNAALMRSFVSRYSRYFGWVAPEAGTVAFLALKNGRDAEAFCCDMAEKAGVLCLPGAMFSYEPHYFRVGFGKEGLGEALDAIGVYLQTCGIESGLSA